MKEIDHKVNIVPVIAKADTLTKAECQKMKKRVCFSLDIKLACIHFAKT